MISTIYFLLNALHVIGFVAWFGGLFYVVRIFVYFSETSTTINKAEWEKQYSLMEQRCYTIIAQPALWITWIAGLSMLTIKYCFDTAFFYDTWIWVKLVLLLLLTVYHFYCGRIVHMHKQNKPILNSFQFRLLNEVPTIFLILIVLLGVFKSQINLLYLFGGVIVVIFLLWYAAKKYKEYRLKK